MTSDVIHAEIDASKIYKQGQAFQVVPIRFNMLGIKLKLNGVIPSALKGEFTNTPRAVQAIEDYIGQRIEYFELQERRKQARKGLKRLQKKEELTEE